MKMKLTTLAFGLLLAVGWTGSAFAQSQEEPFKAAEAKTWTYSWTDAQGTTHNDVDPTLKVTDAWQMYYLLRHVYMDKRFPGPYQSAYTKNNVRERDVYYGGMEGGWDIPGNATTSTTTISVPTYNDIVIRTTSGYVGITSIQVYASGQLLQGWTTSSSEPALPSTWIASPDVTFNNSTYDYSIYLSQGGTITIPHSLIDHKSNVTVRVTARKDASNSSGTLSVNGTQSSTLTTTATPNNWNISQSGTETITSSGRQAIGDLFVTAANTSAQIFSVTVKSGNTTLISWSLANDGMGSSNSTGYWPLGFHLDTWTTWSTSGTVSAIAINNDPIKLDGWLFTGYNSVTVTINARAANGTSTSLSVNGDEKTFNSTTAQDYVWTFNKKDFPNAPVVYQADQYKPNKEGYTVLVVKLKNNITMEPDDAVFSQESFYSTPQQIHDYLETNVESIQLLTDGLVIGEGDQIGTVFNAPIDEYNKFFFLSKGQARQKADIVKEMEIFKEHDLGEQVPFRQMFEQFSPTGGKTGDQITDFYSEMMQGKVYRIVHDCLSVIQNGHQFSMSGNTGSTAYKMSGMNFFIPDYRLKYWEVQDTLKRGDHQIGIYTVDGRTMNPVLRVSSNGDPTYDRQYAIGNSIGSASDLNVWYAQYDTAKHAPLVGLYLINLNAQANPYPNYDEDHRYYQSTLDWTSSLNEMSGNGVSQTYIIYQVTTDPVTGEVKNVPIDTVKNSTDFHPQLTLDTLYQQQAHSYTITYVIQGSPTDSEHPGFVAWSNTATVIIPGYDDFMVLDLHHYESDFVVNQERNYYRNYMQPVNDFANGITAESIRNGYDSFILYRNSTDGKVPVAKLKLAVDSNNRVLYKITYFDENEDYNEPNYDNTVLPTIINQLLNKQ